MREVKQHGTLTGYEYGCRCDDCRRARRDGKRRYRDAQLGITAPHGTSQAAAQGCRCHDCRPLVDGHGTSNCYTRGCREASCKLAYSQYRQEFKLRQRGVAWTAVHGSKGGFALGCRCVPCVRAQNWDELPHGSERMIAAGCECTDCSEFHVQVVTDAVPDMKAQWRRQAACQGCPPEWFDVDRPDLWMQGRAVCDSCPVKAACAEAHVGDAGAFGMFGGVVLWAGREKVGA